jgi:hypothetical protein
MVTAASSDITAPWISLFAPNVIAALLMKMPRKTLLAPLVMAPSTTQKTLLESAEFIRMILLPAEVIIEASPRNIQTEFASYCPSRVRCPVLPLRDIASLKWYTPDLSVRPARSPLISVVVPDVLLRASF